MTKLSEFERIELERLRLQTKALQEENLRLIERIKGMEGPITVQELIEELVCDDDLPVYVYDLSTDEAYPLILVDPTISDRVDLNFRSEPEEL